MMRRLIKNCFHIHRLCPLFLLPLFLLPPLPALAGEKLTFTRSRLLMGHVLVTVKIRASSSKEDQVQVHMDQAFSLAQNLEDSLSEFKKKSDISCLNENAGQSPCPVSPQTMYLLHKALEVAQGTQHAFDPRFASKTKAGRQGRLKLDAKRNQAQLLHPQSRLGLGAIAKGFIVDAMLNQLQKAGYQEVLINAGGDLRALGGDWTVGIRNPSGSPQEASRLFSIANEAMATSGNYEKGAHIYHPKSGKKIFGTHSMTVRAPTLLLADALATAAFVLGKDACPVILARWPQVTLYHTDVQGRVSACSGPPDGPAGEFGGQ